MDQENYRCITALVEEKLRPMPVAIESEPRLRQPAVTHRQDHFQADQLVEDIMGIKKHCPECLSILIQDPSGFQYHQQPPPNPPSSTSVLSCSTSARSEALQVRTFLHGGGRGQIPVLLDWWGLLPTPPPTVPVAPPPLRCLVSLLRWLAGLPPPGRSPLGAPPCPPAD